MKCSVPYRHSVFSAVRRHSVLVICLQAQTVTYTCLFTPSFMKCSVLYRHSVFSAVRRHSVLVICLQAQTVTYTCLFTLFFTNLSVIQTFCLQRCTEAFCLGNMSSGTDSSLHMPINPTDYSNWSAQSDLIQMGVVSPGYELFA